MQSVAAKFSSKFEEIQAALNRPRGHRLRSRGSAKIKPIQPGCALYLLSVAFLVVSVSCSKSHAGLLKVLKTQVRSRGAGNCLG